MSTTLINPATGQITGKVDHTPPEQIPKMFEEARKAQKKWAAIPIAKRVPYLQKMKYYMKENAEDIAMAISTATGKTIQDSLGSEVFACCLAIDWYCKNTAKILNPQSVSAGELLFANKRSTIEYAPSGVIGILSPWNYPLSIPFTEIIMAIISGNAVVYKVAANTVQLGIEIEKIITAGELPVKGLVQHLIARGSKASGIMFENGIDKLFFTGSVDVGKQLMRQAADTLTPVSIEAGGNDPSIVLADADLERTSNGLLWGGFTNTGQSCGGVERVLVVESVYDELLSLMIKKTNAMRHGVPTRENNVEMGSMCTKSQLETVQRHVQDALDKGAKIVAQSKPVGDVSKGFFYPATILTDVTPDMVMFREETFGPVIPLMKVKSIDEAIQLANDSDLGLTASVWTNSTATGRAVANKLEAGVVTINDHLYTHGMHALPWGGPKNSGVGRTHGEIGLKEMCEPKAVNWDIAPAVKRNMWWYPVSSDTFKGLMAGMSYVAPSSIYEYIKALFSLLPFAAGMMFTSWKTSTETKKSK